MANFTVFFFILVNVLVYCRAISDISDVFDDANSCQQKCTESYAPHTYPNGEEEGACARGCRLYTITKFLSSDEPKQITNNMDDDEISPALTLCNRACVEAYNETSPLLTSCQVGCGKQEIISKDFEKNKQEEQSKMEGIHLMRPIMQVREVTSRVIGMLRIVQTSLTTYFMGEDKEMVAVEGPVQIMVQIRRPEPPTEIEHDNSIEKLEIEETPISQSFRKDSVIKVPVEDTNRLTSFYNEISRQDFITYAIMSAMLLAVMVIIYILISRHSKYVKKSRKMNVTTVMPPNALPVKLVRPEDLTKLSLMDEEEAPELSIKVRLPDNTII